MELNMEENNNFIFDIEKESFLQFPEEQIYKIKFIPKYMQKNSSIKLSKYKIIEDNGVFLYE